MALLQQTFPESTSSDTATGFVGVSPSRLALITMNAVRELAEQVGSFSSSVLSLSLCLCVLVCVRVCVCVVCVCVCVYCVCVSVCLLP